MLGEALKVNSSLQNLDLNRNQIGDAGAIVLGEALTVNTSLQILSLYDNQIENVRAEALGSISNTRIYI